MLKMGWATLFPLTKNHDWIGGGGGDGGDGNTENKRKDIVDSGHTFSSFDKCSIYQV